MDALEVKDCEGPDPAELSVFRRNSSNNSYTRTLFYTDNCPA